MLSQLLPCQVGVAAQGPARTPRPGAPRVGREQVLQRGVHKHTAKPSGKGPNTSALCPAEMLPEPPAAPGMLPEHRPRAPLPRAAQGGDAPGHAWLRVRGPTWQAPVYPLPANAMELADNGLGACQNPTCGLQMSLGPANPAGRSVRYERLPSICFRCCSRRSTAIVGGGGSFGEKSINPALPPDCYYLLWFKLSDWGHFFVCCNLPFT